MWAKHFNRIMDPPIVAFKKKLELELQSSTQLLDLTQAIPSYPPPEGVKQALSETCLQNTPYYYTEDQGLLELRQVIAGNMPGKTNSVSADNILITAGANMAFLSAIMTLLEPGDEVILPSPFYFNHEMAVRMCHAVPIEAPLDPSQGFQLTCDDMGPLISPKTRAVVMVTPNNPTGACYSMDKQKALYDLCQARGIFLIQDKTYEYFDNPSNNMLLISERDDWRKTLISLHSFSKTFSMTGLRIGYLVCSEELMQQILKVQDTMVICAPHTAQRAVLAGYTLDQSWLREKVRMMALKVKRFKEAMEQLQGRFDVVSSGAFFGYVRHHFEKTSLEIAYDLAKESGIAVLPGSFFGSGQEQYLRFAFGNIAIEDLEDLAGRLIRFR